MHEIPFSLTLTGTIKIDAGKIIIAIGKSQTAVDLEPSRKTDARLFLRKGETLFDLILSTAQEYVGSRGLQARFTGADLYHIALGKYPHLKRNSWTAHVMASAPSHSSYRHFSVRKDYFTYEGEGTYTLKPEYLPQGMKSVGDREDDDVIKQR